MSPEFIAMDDDNRYRRSPSFEVCFRDRHEAAAVLCHQYAILCERQLVHDRVWSLTEPHGGHADCIVTEATQYLCSRVRKHLVKKPPHGCRIRDLGRSGCLATWLVWI